MARGRRAYRFPVRSASCHPVTLAACLSALLTVLIASTMQTPKALVLALHLPALVLLSLVFACSIPERARAVVLLICGPVAALVFAVYPF